MPKILLQSLIVAAIAFVLAVASLSVWQSFHPSEHHQSPPPEVGAGEPKRDISFLDKTAEDPIAFFTLWLMIFTGVLALFTCWMALSTKDLRDFAEEQASDMKQSLSVAKTTADAARVSADVARQTLIAGQRAWIRIDEIGFGGGALAFDKNGASVSVSFKISWHIPRPQ